MPTSPVSAAASTASAQVDEYGTLRMLRDPATFHRVGEAEVADADERRKANIDAEVAAEDAFLKLVGVHAGASAAGVAEAAKRGVAAAAAGAAEALRAMPCYEDWQSRRAKSQKSQKGLKEPRRAQKSHEEPRRAGCVSKPSSERSARRCSLVASPALSPPLTVVSPARAGLAGRRLHA